VEISKTLKCGDTLSGCVEVRLVPREGDSGDHKRRCD
jgi:hypothetical protein